MLSEFLEEEVLNDNLNKILHCYFQIMAALDIQDTEEKEEQAE